MSAETSIELRAPRDMAPVPGAVEPRGRATVPAAPADAGSAPGAADHVAPAPRPRRRRFSKLTLRVLAINVLALFTLVGGVLYLGRYEERLIQSELHTLLIEGSILAAALAEGSSVGDVDEIPALDIAQARQLIRRLHETRDTRARLFNATDGTLIGDSRLLTGAGGTVEIEPLLPEEDDNWFRLAFDAVYDWVTEILPSRKEWPVYGENPDQFASDYTVVQRALSGSASRQIWMTEDEGLVIGVAVPVQRLRVVMGAVLVTRDGQAIEDALKSLREDILEVFSIAIGITILLSIYLAGTITRPIRRLAAAAERVRHGQSRQTQIPDFTRRHDEIGDLSGAVREMTEALWNRMDAIERFAADVAHEIKNPLTSLRSAVETTARVTDPTQQRRLMAIILKDVERLNRLITDISDASRLDAELSRAQGEPVDMRTMLEMLAELYRATTADDGLKFELHMPSDDRELCVYGLEGRLVQVLRNLIGNAITFSPEGGTITLRLTRDGRTIQVTVRDEGPGIPAAKLDAIFDRFYTERPEGEEFGNHSGLGLAISKQIVEAHGGQVFARNCDQGGGAIFFVRLPAC